MEYRAEAQRTNPNKNFRNFQAKGRIFVLLRKIRLSGFYNYKYKEFTVKGRTYAVGYGGEIRTHDFHLMRVARTTRLLYAAVFWLRRWDLNPRFPPYESVEDDRTPLRRNMRNDIPYFYL